MQVHVNTSTILFFFYLPASGVLPSCKVMHLQPAVLSSQYLPKLSAFPQEIESKLLLDKTSNIFNTVFLATPHKIHPEFKKKKQTLVIFECTSKKFAPLQ